FVIAIGIGYISSRNWTGIPHEERKLPEQQVLAETAEELAKAEDAQTGAARKWAQARYGAKAREVIVRFDKGEGKLAVPEETDLALDTNYNLTNPEDLPRVEAVIGNSKEKAEKKTTEKWGMLGTLGLNEKLAGVDDSTRSNFTPYGFSGVMLGAALVFFAFIG